MTIATQMARKLTKAFLDKCAPQLSRKLRQVRDARRTIGEPVYVDQLGFKFYSPHTSMQAADYERDEVRAFSRLIEDVDTFVNVGANVGYYVCLALKVGKRVIAFEPIAENLKILERNILANKWQNEIELFPVVVSNRIGIEQMYGSGEGASLLPGWSEIPLNYVRSVPSLTLDRTLAGQALGRTLVMIDVEGAELSVLQGATELLRSSVKPIWFVEIAFDEHQPKGISHNPHFWSTFNLFRQLDYSAYAVGPDIRRIDYSVIEEMASTKQKIIKYHNFIFVDRAFSLLNDLFPSTSPS